MSRFQRAGRVGKQIPAIVRGGKEWSWFSGAHWVFSWVPQAQSFPVNIYPHMVPYHVLKLGCSFLLSPRVPVLQFVAHISQSTVFIVFMFMLMTL
ncbi:hypothetical protein XENTR_v10003728 [Xenopus tropicalis]|nr:hypothetical protein XENTR_v10003728 [Xenopus tropicalis]